MPRLVASDIHPPKHLTPFIQPSGDAKGSSKHIGRGPRDQIGHLALLPKKWVNGRPTGNRVTFKVHFAAPPDLPFLFTKNATPSRPPYVPPSRKHPPPPQTSFNSI